MPLRLKLTYHNPKTSQQSSSVISVEKEWTISRLEDLARKELGIKFGHSLSFTYPGAESTCISPDTVGDLGVVNNSVLIVNVMFRQSGRDASTKAKVGIKEETKEIEKKERHENYLKRKAEEKKKMKKLDNDRKLAAEGVNENKKKKIEMPGVGLSLIGDNTQIKNDSPPEAHGYSEEHVGRLKNRMKNLDGSSSDVHYTLKTLDNDPNLLHKKIRKREDEDALRLILHCLIFGTVTMVHKKIEGYVLGSSKDDDDSGNKDHVSRHTEKDDKSEDTDDESQVMMTFQSTAKVGNLFTHQVVVMDSWVYLKRAAIKSFVVKLMKTLTGDELGDRNPLQPHRLINTKPDVFWSIVCHGGNESGVSEIKSEVNEVTLAVGGYKSYLERLVPDIDWSFIREAIGEGNRAKTAKSQKGEQGSMANDE